MPRLAHEQLTPYDIDIEITLQKLRKEKCQKQVPVLMEEQDLQNPNPPLAPLCAIG